MKTTEYDKFSFFYQNRNINHGLVNRLIHSIEKIGYIESSYITCDANYRIYDGQHRFIACKQLGIPILFKFTNTTADVNDVIIELNSNQLIWRLLDYVRLHAKNEIPFYVFLNKVHEGSEFGISADISICSGSYGSCSAKIRQGVDLPIFKHWDGVYNFLRQCKNLPFNNNVYFVRAIITLFKKASEKQINMVLKYHSTILKQTEAIGYLAIMENIINKHCSIKIRL